MTRLLIGLIDSSRQRTLLFLTFFMLALASACNSTPQTTAPGASPTPATATEPATSGSSAPVAATAAGAFEGTITANLHGGGQSTVLKYAIKGQRARVETNLAQGGSAMAIVLMDMSSGEQTMLMPQAKTYMTMNLNDDKVKEMTERAAKAAGGRVDESTKITPTGKTETVAGYTCEHWLMTSGQQQTDMCLAKGLGFFGSSGQLSGVLSQLKNLPFGDRAKAMLDANPEFARFAESGAFPLKIAQVENGQTKPIMEVTSVERKPLDAALFTVPADYKKMNLPGLSGAK